jgi:hypothetical protein
MTENNKQVPNTDNFRLVVNLKPGGYQEKFLYSKRKFPALISGIGTGKTLMLLLKVWKFCEDHPRALCMVVRKEFTDLRDSTIKDFERYFGVVPDSNKEFRFANGSMIMFRHAAEVNVLKNINLSMFAIEQAEEFETEEQFVYLRDRLRNQATPYRQGIVIANANGHNWLWRLWVNNPNGEEYDLSTANTFDNEENLPADFIEDLKRMEKDAPNHYKQYVLNSFDVDNASDRLFSTEKIEEATNLKLQAEWVKTRVLGVDVARFGDDETVFTVLFSRGSLQWEMIEQQRFKGASLMETVGRIVDMTRLLSLDAIVVDDTGLGCMTADTKILTEDGWVKVKDIKKNTKIYSKGSEGNVVLEKVTSITHKDRVRTINADGYCFSWNHLVPYRTRLSNKQQLKNWEDVLKNKQIVFESDFQYEAKEKDFTLKEQAIVMPHGGTKKIRNEKRISATDFAEYLGWYVSEGNFGRNGVLQITQNKNKYFDRIVELSSLFGKPSIKKNGTAFSILISNVPLKKWIMKNCYRGGFGFKYKTVPRFIANNSKGVINSFLNAFCGGDGYIHHGERYYVTSSVNLTDDLVELIHKAGKKSGVYLKSKKGSKFSIEGRIATRTEDNYVVFECRKNRKGNQYGLNPKTKKESEQSVYSILISGKTKLMFTKYENKRPVWTHNGGVTDRLSELDIPVIPFIAGGKSANRLYRNRKAEAYFKLKEYLDKGRLKILNDLELKNQMLTIKYKYGSDGKKQILSKDEMKKEGLKSPDCVESLMMALFHNDDIIGLGENKSRMRQAKRNQVFTV